jgi:hypothetical protein
MESLVNMGEPFSNLVLIMRHQRQSALLVVLRIFMRRKHSLLSLVIVPGEFQPAVAGTIYPANANALFPPSPFALKGR